MSLPGYAVTPLRESPALAARLGVGRLLLKDETDCLGLPSFKIFGASWAVVSALQDTLGDRGDPDLTALRRALVGRTDVSVTAATAGNHGRAVARVARWLGVDARIYVPESMRLPTRSLIAAEGAEVVVVAGSYDDAVRAAAADPGLLVADTSSRPDDPGANAVLTGYQTILAQTEQQLRAARAVPTVVVAQAGVGSFAGAVAAALLQSGAAARLVTVEPLAAACVLASVRAGEPRTVQVRTPSVMAGLNCGEPSAAALPLLLRRVDAAVAIADSWATRAVDALAADGLSVGPAGAAGVGGLLAAARALSLGRGDTVVAFLTEGAIAAPECSG
jgi:diaminopropionate ammonia-lyase